MADQSRLLAQTRVNLGFGLLLGDSGLALRAGVRICLSRKSSKRFVDSTQGGFVCAFHAGQLVQDFLPVRCRHLAVAFGINP